jgi:hypothetical protein
MTVAVAFEQRGEPRRAVYVLDTIGATYTACSLPGLRRYAAAYDRQVVFTSTCATL